jgi:nucleoside-diphosphate-sugar epimerase
MLPRIAITGGRGRLAPHLAAHFRDGRSEVACFSQLAGDGFQDISRLIEPRILTSFDAILHCAWSTVPLTSEEKPGLEEVNDMPLLQGILQACGNVRHPPVFVFFSTAAVYGNTSVLATEETAPHPLGGYARAKLRAEEIIGTVYRQHRALRCAILRVSNVFGWTTSSLRPQGIVNRICRAIHDETPLPRWGSGENIKDYLFLSDFLEAVHAVVVRGLRGTFNIASEKSLSVNQIISLVEGFTGKTLTRAPCPAFSWDVEKSYISARKLRQATGWYARHDLAEAIRELTEAELKCV